MIRVLALDAVEDGADDLAEQRLLVFLHPPLRLQHLGYFLASWSSRFPLVDFSLSS